MSAASGFLRSCERFPRRPALEADGTTLTYGELYDRAASLAATLAEGTPAGGPPLTAVFAHRTPTAFAGVLGALLHGHGYVPLNRRYPAERTRAMLARAGCRALVADAESATQLRDVLAGVADEVLVVLPDLDDAGRLAAQLPQHSVVTRSGLASAERFEPVAPGPDDLAYLLFTSGSTGVPKGVMVAHRNIESFAASAAERLDVTEHDRLSQTADLTFDLSSVDLYTAWERGACICCPSEQTLFRPGAFIRDAHLTMWCSVPSTTLFMQRLGMLKPGRYPELRSSVFCGEPLLLDAARAWRAATPNAALHNLYGPTELTVACTAYSWDDDDSPPQCERGIVPIGAPFPGMEPLVVDDGLREVAPGVEGELLMTGPQLTLGYWRDEERTAASYVVPPGRAATFYRTGDRVVRPAAGPMLYRGRADQQIKVLGHRVELGEVEAAIRDVAGVSAVVAVGWPPVPTGAGGIAAFVGANGLDPELLRRRVATRLPDYMVPRRIDVVPALPLNANGKFDRGALVRRLEAAR